RYKFKVNPTASTTITWYEVFVPEDDPETEEDESENAQMIGQPKTWTPGGSLQSEVYELEPNPALGNGTYYVVFPPDLVANDVLGAALDEGEEDSSAVHIRPPGLGVPNPTFDIAYSDVPGVVDTLTWNNLLFTIFNQATGQVIRSGDPVTAGR